MIRSLWGILLGRGQSLYFDSKQQLDMLYLYMFCYKSPGCYKFNVQLDAYIYSSMTMVLCLTWENAVLHM